MKLFWHLIALATGMYSTLVYHDRTYALVIGALLILFSATLIGRWLTLWELGLKEEERTDIVKR